MRVRPLEEQFEQSFVSRLRSIQERYSTIQSERIVPRYLVTEANQCLESGLLLAGLQVSCSILEFVVRRLFVRSQTATFQSGRPNTKPVRLSEAEADRDLTFGRMVKQLEADGIVTSADAASLRGIYGGVRIPVQHGALGRYARERTDPFMLSLFDQLELTSATDSHRMEEAIEHHAIGEIEAILDHLEHLGRRRAV